MRKTGHRESGWHNRTMVEVCTLGTGTPNPDPERAASGVAVITENHGWMLIDCGRAVTQRALQAELDLTQLQAVLLTHHHSDHVSDLATLATARWTSGAGTPLSVIAPRGPCARYAERCLDPYEDQSFYSQAPTAAGKRPRIGVSAFQARSRVSTVFDSPPWKVKSALVDHQPIEAAVGYRVEVGGAVVTLSGDTAVGNGIEVLASEADLLVHQAVRADLVSPGLLAWNASATSVGDLARRTSVGRLILTHLLPSPGSAAPADEFVADVRDGGYTGPVDVARDLFRLRIS